MAERSAEERINLWYQQYHHILTQARNEFRNLTQYPRLDAATFQAQFADAVQHLKLRADYLRDNPAEVVQDRLAALHAKAMASLRNAPRVEYAPTAEDMRIAEAIDHVSDPDYQGWMAEQRFHEEQGEPFDYSYEGFLRAGDIIEEVRATRPDGSREAYIAAVVRDAIQTGIEEGYPLRDPQALPPITDATYWRERLREARQSQTPTTHERVGVPTGTRQKLEATLATLRQTTPENAEQHLRHTPDRGMSY